MALLGRTADGLLQIERVNGDGEESADDTPSPSVELSEEDEAPPERKFGATALQRSLMGGLSSIKSMWSSAYEMVGGNGEDFEKKLFERLCRSVLRGFNVVRSSRTSVIFAVSQ